jgi:hypothetical protein
MIAFWLGAIVFLFAYLWNGLRLYQRQHRTPFKFQQQLPFELHDAFFQPSRLGHPGRWFLMVGMISLFAFWESVLIQPAWLVSYLLLALLVIWIIATVSLFVMQIKKIEIYLMLVSLHFVSAVMMLLLASYLTLTGPYFAFQTFLPWTTMAQGIFQLFLVANPKLKQWAKLEKVGEENEKPLYRRPTYFVMAYTQWLTLANVLLWVLLTQIEYFIG